jgi:protein ImuA
VSKTAIPPVCTSHSATRFLDDADQPHPVSSPPGGSEVLVRRRNGFRQRCVASSTCAPQGADGPDPLGPSAPPVPPSRPQTRRQILDGLRAKMRALEGASTWLPASCPMSHAPVAPTQPLPRSAQTPAPPSRMLPHPESGVFALPSPEVSASLPAAWTLGEAAFDDLLPGGGLDPAGVIELKPGDHGDWPAVLTFAACLAVRRRSGSVGGKGEASRSGLSSPVVWCSMSALAGENGRLYGRGLAHLGLSPEAVIAVEAPRAADALWTLEESLRSRALSLVVGMLTEVDLTPSRRLGLAAAAGLTPALLLTLPASAPAPSATLRLRLCRLPSAPHPIDPKAPGRPRFRLSLERSRGNARGDGAVSLELQWCNVAHRFHLATSVAHRTYAPADARLRAWG